MLKIRVKISRNLFILLCGILVSCNASKKIVYMQDAENGASDTIVVNQGIVIQPKDILTIVVSSKDPELSMAYNLPLMSYQAGSTSSASSYSQRLLGYLVDMDGNIDFPIFGKLKAAGLTREQFSKMIKQRFIQENIIKDAVVTTEFMNFKISVLGEVRNPGTFSLGDDKITILEALGRAGDMTIYGRRDNVLVTREQNGIVHHYRIDLRSNNIFHSPAFYLQQNDVVYVEPNKAWAARSGINENRSVSVAISLASLLTTLAVLIFK